MQSFQSTGYVDIVEVASSILAVPTNNVFLIIYNNQYYHHNKTQWLNRCFNKNNLFAIYNYIYIDTLPGNFCEGAIPDPIPNSEVKPFSADGTMP